MLRKSSIIKTLSILPIVFFRKSNLLIYGYRYNATIPIAELFLQNMFSGNPSRMHTNIVIVMFGLVEVIVFNLLFGTYIYRDLYENSIYIFVRQKSRGKWFHNRSAQLFVYSAVYHGLFVFLTFLLCMRYSNQRVDIVAIRVVLTTYILIQLFAFWTTLVINLLAVRLGATASFIVNYVVLLVLSMVALNHEKIPVIKDIPFVLSLNPVANVTINWNDGIGKGLFPAVYFIILITITMILGGIMISKTDISLENKEQNS
jgi:hypothetical protein